MAPVGIVRMESDVAMGIEVPVEWPLMKHRSNTDAENLCYNIQNVLFFAKIYKASFRDPEFLLIPANPEMSMSEDQCESVFPCEKKSMDLTPDLGVPTDMRGS